MYTLGLDFGTNTVRALIVRTSDGMEAGTGVAGYEHGEAGILLDPRHPDQARQHPADYLKGVAAASQAAMADACSDSSASSVRVG